MNEKVKVLVGLVAFAALIAAAYFAYTELSARNEPPVTVMHDLQRAPDFTVMDENGDEVSLADIHGTPVVLNFWASWCPACVQESPYFNDLYNDIGDEVRILKVNLMDGQRETRESAMDFVANNGYTFPVYFDTTGQASGAYGVMFIPMTVFINAEGYITDRIQGAAGTASLLRGIGSLR